MSKTKTNLKKRMKPDVYQKRMNGIFAKFLSRGLEARVIRKTIKDCRRLSGSAGKGFQLADELLRGHVAHAKRDKGLA